MKIIKILLSIAITIISFLSMNYFLLVGIKLDNLSFWFLLLISLGISTVIMSIIEFFLKKKYFGTIFCSVIALFCFIVIFFGGIASAKIFHVSSYRDQITINENGDFAKDIPLISDNIPVVDVETARIVGERTMGTLESYVSQFRINQEYNLVIYQGKQYRISPLEYDGFIKYFSNSKDGIPGYILVDVLTQEAKFVKLDDGIKYSPSAYFGNNLYRYLRNKYPTKIFSKMHFEIDEKGTPYYIVPTGDNKMVFGGYKVEDVIILNAITGDCKTYALDNIPEWVDHVYSLDYLMDKVENKLSLVNGIFNFSQKGVKKTSYEYRSDYFEGYNTIVTSSGQIGFFTGVTSASSDESNLGFIIANCKTGEVTYYTCPGAEEASAKSSAEGLVQQYGYTSSYPIIINVNGNETYFMTLKDSGGIVKKYALVNVRNYSISVEADSVSELMSKYSKRLQNTPGSSLNNNEDMEKTEVISDIKTAIIDGYTYYYFSFANDSNIYMSSITNSNLQVSLKIGDSVTIKYHASSEDRVMTVKSLIIK